MAVALVVLSVEVPRADAQQLHFSERAIEAMPATYSEPLCELKGKHWKTTAANKKLKAALEATIPARRRRELDKGKALQLEAIAQNEQSGSSTAWFALARIYLYQGDLVGADSALEYASRISPVCAGMFEDLRYRVWLPLITAASDFAKANANDSALTLFRQAAAIDPRDPQAALSAGVILANAGETDSAIAYFQQAANAGDLAGMTDARDQAMLNLGLMLQRAGRHAEAITALERYLQSHGADVEAKRALSVSYHETGEHKKAKPLDAELLEAAAGSAARSDYEETMRIGLTYYSEKRWAEAARAFELAVEAAPYDREAAYALANTYLAMGHGARLAEAAAGLVAREPLNADALTMLGTGYRETKQQGRALDAAERLFALPVDLVMQRMVSGSEGTAALTGRATGRSPQTAQGKPISPRSVSLVFEFVDQRGRVVARSPAEIPELQPGQTHEIAVEVRGTGIAGWRYSIVASKDRQVPGTTATR